MSVVTLHSGRAKDDGLKQTNKNVIWDIMKSFYTMRRVEEAASEAV